MGTALAEAELGGLYVRECFRCLNPCASLCCLVSQEARRSIGATGYGVTGSYEMLFVDWGLTPGPCKAVHVLNHRTFSSEKEC